MRCATTLEIELTSTSFRIVRPEPGVSPVASRKAVCWNRNGPTGKRVVSPAVREPALSSLSLAITTCITTTGSRMVHRDLDLRHKLRKGETHNGFQSELGRLAEEWLELGRLEPPAGATRRPA